MILCIQAHSRDMNTITLVEKGEETILIDGDYVPNLLGIGGGDDIAIAVDVETGKIVGWDAEAVKRRITEMQNGDED